MSPATGDGPTDELPVWVRVLFNDPAAIALPPTESPFLGELLQNIPLPDEQRELVQRFADDGLLVFDIDLTDLGERVDRILAELSPRYAGENRRVHEAWYFSDDVRGVAAAPAALALLRLLYQREPIPFQTLNFEVGTEQNTHSDLIHFYSLPRRYMCGVWVALEDVDGDNGPLHYYPGSHRLPDFDLHDLGLPARMDSYDRYENFVDGLMRAAGLPRRELHLKRGQAVVWAANLFHGGSKVRDPRRTRHSQVTHYFFEDCMHWFPAESDALLGTPCLREVIDVRSGRFVTPTHLGRAVDLDAYERVWRYPRPLPEHVTRHLA